MDYSKYTCEQLIARITELEGLNRELLAAKPLQKHEAAWLGSERRLNDIINFLPDATFVIDNDGQVIYWNKAIEEMTGIPKEQMIGRGNYEYAIPFYGERRIALIDIALKSGNNQSGDNYNCFRQEGDTFWGEICIPNNGGKGTYLWLSASKLYDVQGNTIGAIQTIRDITARKKEEEQRENLLQLLQTMFDDHIAVMLLIEPLTGKIADANPAACTFYGYTKEELLNMFIQDINMLSEEEVQIRRLMALEAKQRYFVFPHRLKSGEIRMVDVYSCPVIHNEVKMLYSIIFDVTDREKYKEELYLEKELFRATLLSIGDGVITTDRQGMINVINKVAEQLTGWTQEEAFGRPLEEVFNIVNEFTRERCENPAQKVLDSGNIVQLDDHTKLISKEGVERSIQDSAAPIKDKDNNINGVVIVFGDFTDKKERQEKIEYLSFHDQLTGLYNRRFFEEELKRLDIERNLPLTLIMADVNGLKLTNDAFGHLVGDKILIKVAEVMKRVCRADDIIARIGGDEFVVILPKTDFKQAEMFVKRIHDDVADEQVESINLSVSCGWGTKQDTGEEIATIFKNAEDHMYRLKLSESSSIRHKTIEIIIKTLYQKNKIEQQHAERVSRLCVAMGVALDLSQENVKELRITGLMHDIGKIAIDSRILDKLDPLSDAEWLEIKRHPEVGYQILRSVNEFAPLAEYVLAHHERWDGNGYPKRLRGEEIPLESRIIAVVDAYEAMTTVRPYRKALNEDVSIKEIITNAGTQFDPVIARVFVQKVLGKE